MQFFTEFVTAVWNTGVALAPSLFLGMLIAGVLHVFVNKDKIYKHMGKPGFRSSLKASLIGVPLPLCSCGVLPAALGLRRDGASKGAAVSFLSSTPQTGVDSIAATWALLGWPVALAKVIAAFVAGVVSGTVVDSFDRENRHISAPRSETAEEKGSIPRRIWRYAFGTLFRDIYLWLFIGVAVSAIITVFIEPGQLADYPVLAGPMGMLAALAIGIPLYVCSVSSVPIAAALVYAGFPVGSALVFLMAGPATNAATMGAVRKSLGKLSFWSYIVTIVVVSLLAGLLLNGLDIPVNSLVRHHETPGAVGILRITAAAFFFILIAYYAAKDIARRISLGNTVALADSGVITYNVSAMTCSNCVRTVTESLQNLVGVSSVKVSLEDGSAVVVPGAGYSSSSILETLRKIGHTGELRRDNESNGAECSCSSCNT
ncbi:MAG: permease [Candidatus Fermentibacteraceae bacterium]|nr:permease [Candidatus Fermentibacteraceae bacterium]